MKHTNALYTIIAALIVLLVGLYSVDNKDENSPENDFSMPELETTSDVTSSEEKPASTLQDFNNAISEIAEKTIPTVVTVRVTQTVETQPHPFSRFFGNPNQEPEERQRRGLGSGVIVSEDGYILTNHHVVEEADEITISLSNGNEYDGEVVGSDPQTDIAVLKVDAEDADDLEPITFGNSDNVRVGEMILAIGSPLGEDLAHSVSMGIVSAKGRAVQIIDRGQGYESFIQTDAAINPGNSGGAMVNMDGELVGINTAIASRSGGNDGIGFAVPVKIAESIMESLIEDGKVSRGYLGIQGGGEVDRTMARALELDKSHGVIVGGVEDGGPGEEAGLKEGDVIQSLNGEKVNSWFKFRTSIATSKPDSEVTLGVVRDGEEMEIEVTLGEMPTEGSVSTSQQSDQDMEDQLGFEVDDLTSDIARQLGLDPGQEGVVVRDIGQGSKAYSQGLRRGDIITSVARNPVTSVDEFREQIQAISESGEDVVLLQVIREGTKQYIAFEL